MSQLIPQDHLERSAPLIRAAAHPVRLRVLDYLRDRSASVGEIAEATGCSQAVTSQHLAVLRKHGILEASRSGRQILYRIERPELLGLLDCIRRHCRQEQA